MKQLIRILSLVVVLLLLVGCGNSANSKEGKSPPTVEPTIQLDLTNPAATTPATTTPTDSVLAETTAPVETTVATEPTAPAETTTPTIVTEPTAAPIPAISAGFGAVYADICRLLDSGDRDLEYAYATQGMVEIAAFLPTAEERYASITYALEDLDGDGRAEMIVLDAMGNTRILGIYAIRDGVPVMTHEGWSRSRLYRLSDGTLYSEGSGGAAYAIFEAYGQCWFTWPKDEDQMEIGFYHSADGTYDPAAAEEITADEYEAKQIVLAQKISAFEARNFG